MTDPVLHLLVGPNGAGKSTLAETIIKPVTHVEFVNADAIAAEHWPHGTVDHAYEAARMAAQRRTELIAQRASFITETVFSHESKLTLVRDAIHAGYLVKLHVIMIPEELAVARVHNRVANGGHDVPVDKIRDRYTRLWPFVAQAIALVDEATIYDNTTASDAFCIVATYRRGRPLLAPNWPGWAPLPLTETTPIQQDS